MSVAWFRRSWYNLPVSVNQLVDPDLDWTPFQTTNPLTGAAMTLYNLNPAKAGQALFFDSSSTDHSKTRRDYTGFELGATVRLPRGGTLIGGWSADRTINVSCENPDPNQRYNCDQSQFDIPLRNDFKFIGTYPVGFGVQLGAVLQSYAGAAVPVSWSVPASVYPGARRTAALTLSTSVVGTGYTGSSLSDPGTSYLPRWNQLDFSVRRSFHIGRTYLDGSVDMFNAMNSSTVWVRSQATAPRLDNPLKSCNRGCCGFRAHCGSSGMILDEAVLPVTPEERGDRGARRESFKDVYLRLCGLCVDRCGSTGSESVDTGFYCRQWGTRGPVGSVCTRSPRRWPAWWWPCPAVSGPARRRALAALTHRASRLLVWSHSIGMSRRFCGRSAPGATGRAAAHHFHC